MSLFEFSKLPAGRRPDSSERLLRAAVYAFCSLTRPTRREIAQLDDLALPLISRCSRETLRYVAAALSESRYAPAGLVRRLCDQPLEIAAPLLVRSTVLADIDLISIIGHQGLPHARAIARRSRLNPRIAELIAALEALDTAERQPAAPSNAEETREKLRVMMMPAAPQAEHMATGARSRWPSPPGNFEKLRSTALTGIPDLFHRALADALELDLDQARALTGDHARSDFMLALRALDLGEEQAFLVSACVCGRDYAHPEAIRLFLERYRAMSPAMARSVLRGWRTDAIAAAVWREERTEQDEEMPPAAANQQDRAALLRVS